MHMRAVYSSSIARVLQLCEGPSRLQKHMDSECRRENDGNPYAVAVLKTAAIVGHIP